MTELERSLVKGEQVLAKIMRCDIEKQRRVTYIAAIMAAVLAIGFTVAGLILEDFLYLAIGVAEALVGAMLCAGRFYILRLYEEIQDLMTRAAETNKDLAGYLTHPDK